MPNRVIKETIRTSESLNNLSDFEFRLWIGLLVSADDAGRGDARPAIIKGSVFPLRERVTVKDVDAALHGLAANGCVSLYKVGGKPYYWFPTWAAHQRIDRAKPKFPPPEDADEVPQENAFCGNPPQVAASCRKSRAESNTIQSEYESNSNTKEKVRAARFHPPTVDEVAAFVQENGLTDVDPLRFVDFYASKGWMVGKSPMKDWKAACRGWQRRNDGESAQGTGSSKPKPTPNNPALDYEQRTYTPNDFGDGFFIDLEKEYGSKE